MLCTQSTVKSPASSARLSHRETEALFKIGFILDNYQSAGQMYPDCDLIFGIMAKNRNALAALGSNTYTDGINSHVFTY